MVGIKNRGGNVIKVSDVEAGKIKRNVVSLTVGAPGTGKTHLSATYPKCFFIITEPNGSETWMNKKELRDNVVGYEYFIPDASDNDKSLKAMYGNVQTSTIIKEINLAKEMAKKGEVETLVLDNLTYLIHNKWMHIDKYEQQFSKQGERNKMAEYGSLRSWCYDFMLNYVMNFPGNIVINCHELLESDEAMERKIDKTIMYSPNIIGGFRDDIMGLVSNVFFLMKQQTKEGGKEIYRHYAITNKRDGRNGKNRFNLPSVIENPSYQTIKTEIDNAMKGVK
jgi:hypothetical protein